MFVLKRFMVVLFFVGVLRILFDILYDEDIIFEDGFNQWEKSKDFNE